MNFFKYLLVNSHLLTGQLPTSSTLVFRVSLSFFSLLHWNIRWSTVCMPCLHGHSRLPIIFNLCKYDRIYPWLVIIGLKFKFTASLPSTIGKNSLVIAPFVVSSHHALKYNKYFGEDVNIGTIPLFHNRPELLQQTVQKNNTASYQHTSDTVQFGVSNTQKPKQLQPVST
jgi:hypothetical protein